MPEGKCSSDFAQSYHDQQGPLRSPPRRRIGAGDRCLVVLNGWAIVRTTTSRQLAGARTLRDLHDVMIINEARLHYQQTWFQAEDSLTTTKRILAYLTAGVPETEKEMFWLLVMNPKRRPICRQRLATGPLVAVQVGVQKVFLTLALAEAKSFACLRTQPSGSVQPTLADGRLAWGLREMSRLCHVEFVDYLIAHLDGSACYSWRENYREAA